MDNAGQVARTHFITIWAKSLQNLGICDDMEHKPEQVKKELQDFFEDIGGSHYTAICKSAKGEYHIHEVVTFEKAKRCKAVATLYGKAHTEVMRGTKEQAKAYIDKEPPFDEKGEEIVLKWGDPTALTNNAGSRTDLKAFDNIALSDNFKLNDFLLTLTSERDAKLYTARYSRLLKREAQTFRRVEVIYIEGEAGSGKTRSALEAYPHAFKASVDEKTAFPFDGYEGEKVLILDELREGVFTHAYLMQLLDGYKMTVNVKGGSMPACWTKVIIASAYPLKEWYKGAYLDKEGKKKQLLRRISRHLYAKSCQLYDYDTNELTTL